MSEQNDPQTSDRFAGLRVDPGALEGDPFARRASWLSSLRASGRGWVAAAIAAGVLVLAWQFSKPVSNHIAPNEVPGSSAAPERVAALASSSPARLQAEDPTALKQQLIAELRAAGLEPVAYDRLGLSGVDVQLPDPVPDSARAVLAKHGVPLPADGIVRIEIVNAR